MTRDDPESGLRQESSVVNDHNSLLSEKPVGSAFLVSRLGGRIGRALWHSLKKTAYVVFFVIVVLLLLVGLDKLAELALKSTHLSNMYPGDFTMARRDFTRPVSHYDYDLTPGVVFQDTQVKGNRYEYANNAGFRDPRLISLKKPEDEFRIFLTGGSTAFGLGAMGGAGPMTHFYYLEHRETISHMLEKILNATAPVPGKTIRVYNTAVWGYSYQHLLLRYVTKLRQYKPDLVVSLDGANELLPVSTPAKEWNYFQEGQFNSILRQIFAYNGPGLASYLTLWLKNNTFLMTFFWQGADPFLTMEPAMKTHRDAVPGQGPQDSEQTMSSEERSRILTENVNAVVRVIEDYHSVLDNDGVPHIFALQPLLYLSKKPRHEWEQKVEPLEEHKHYYGTPADQLYKFIINRIGESAQRKQYLLADFSDYFDDSSEWVFTDWCHLTAGANYLIAKELANLIKENFFQKPLTESDKIDNKNSFFWNMALTAKTVYAPPVDDPKNGPESVLIDYPGQSLYSSKDVPPGEKLELVLDLGQEFTLSRLRIVWDDDSVPEEWAVDFSSDGQNWNLWTKGDNKVLDEFSRWPGYEYYGAESIQSRFLRYRPVKSDIRRIKLRSWSVHR